MSIEQKIEYFKSIQTGFDTIVKWSFALNGAACAGLMTFLGNTVDKQKLFADWLLFGTAMTWFVVGMVMSLFCYSAKLMSLHFSSQYLGVEENSTERNLIYLATTMDWFICLLVSLGLWIASLSCFIVGILYAKWAIFV